MNKVKEVALEAGVDVEVSNQRDNLLLITLDHIKRVPVIVFGKRDGAVSFRKGCREFILIPREVEDLTPTTLRSYIAMVDQDYACEVYALENLKEIKELAARYKTLEEKYNRVSEKYRGLKEHLKYAPEGPGAVAAQAHFEAILPQ